MNSFFRLKTSDPLHETIIRCLINLSASLVVGLSVAAFIGIRASADFVASQDPIFGISTRTVFLLFAATGLGIALTCLSTRNMKLQLTLMLWLVMNAAVYAVGIQWNGSSHLGMYLGNVSGAFRLSPDTAWLLLKMIFFLLLTGCAVPLAWLQLNRSKFEAAVPLRMSCPACGGHIKFSRRNLGQQTPCPHCQKTITLRRPNLLKMSCFFCKGHIEFPAYAIGEKLRCPHCHQDITLKEPAIA